MSGPTPLRIAFIAGTLGQGGAEKQLVYMVTELRARGVDARVYSLRRGEHYEGALRDLGAGPVWVGRSELPPIRLARLIRELRQFRPHIVQAAHFFVNLYAVISAKAVGAVAIGAIRNDAVLEIRANGLWGLRLLRAPAVLIANSETARRNAVAAGAAPAAVHVVANVLAAGGRSTPMSSEHPAGEPSLLAIGRLVPAKRFDRFVDAFARVRREIPSMSGLIAGTGPERERLEAQAGRLDLDPTALRMPGHLPDITAELGRDAILVLTSDHEGLPNVLLEAMAAGLPVVTTPAGDAASVIRDGETGYVVGFDDEEALVARLLELARSPSLRRKFGEAGRRRAATEFGPEQLAPRLFTVYRWAAKHAGAQSVLEAIQQAERRADPPRPATPGHAGAGSAGALA